MVAIAFTRIERRDQPLIQRRESDLRVNSSAPYVKWTARLPSPEKSAYRHVGFARFPVDDNPVSQDLADNSGPERATVYLRQPTAMRDSELQ